MTRTMWCVTVAGAALVCLASAAYAVYVDQTIDVAMCTDYSPATRACGGGSDTAYSTLAAATAADQPGYTVILRAGTYSAQINPTVSGSAGQPITYKNYPGEDAVFSGGAGPAISLSGVRYLVIEATVRLLF